MHHQKTTSPTNKIKMRTTNIQGYIELLEVFHICLTNGLLRKEEVIKWADNIIQHEEQLDYIVIELSVCGHKSVNEIISIINEFVGEPKPIVPGRVVLGFLFTQFKAGHISLRKVTAAIYWLVWNGNLTEDEKSFMYGLDDKMDCAERGIYGTVEAVERETLRFIEIYSDFKIGNFDKWSEINKTIEEKVRRLASA